MDTINTMMNSIPDDNFQEGPIRTLNIDTLLIIFNFLSIYDKLTAMRVNKKWYQIISTQHHAWAVIDFTEKGPRKKCENNTEYRWFVAKTGPHVFERRECGNKWTFPKTQVLRFLNRHAGPSLRQLYIDGRNTYRCFDSEAIIKYPLINCPNIQVLGLHLTTVCKQLPQTLVSLKLKYRSFDGSSKSSTNEIISCVSKCKRLQNLTLDMRLFSDGKKMLSEMTHLQKLDLSINSHTSAVRISNFESTIGKMVFLQHFRLSGVVYGPQNLDHVLQSIAHWAHLKILILEGLRCKNEAFEIMISQLLNLEKLKLTGISMTESVLQMIGTHLKKLKSLELPSGFYAAETSDACDMNVSHLLNLEILKLAGDYVTSSVVQSIGTHLKKLISLDLHYGCYTAESLQSLSHHPMLEHLVVMEHPALARMNSRSTWVSEADFQLKHSKWVEDVYKVLVTLPRIRTVKLLLSDFDFVFPEIKYVIDSAEIELVSLNDSHKFSKVGPAVQGKVVL